jgi:hypothetical protein
MPFSKRTLFAFFIPMAAILPLQAAAGVVNPDISAIGQVRGGITGDAGSPDQNRPALNLGEAEFIFEAALNPYFRGAFTVSAGEEGLGLEEAYTTMTKGLPWGLGLKAGKYRLGFGKANPVHPHALPFLEPPRAWVSLLPGGEEGFNQTALQVSELLPTPGTWASVISADVLQGDAFHPGDDRTRLGWLGRWSNSFMVGDGLAVEGGVSGATGMDAIDANARGYLLGADAKAKFYLSGASQLTVQAEAAFRRSHSVDTAAGTVSAEDRRGFYAFADYRYQGRYNGGLLAEQWQREGAASRTDRSLKIFGGYAVLEESTLLRLAVEHFMPEGGPAVNTFSAQLLFSMGPHKPHQF